MEPEKSHIHPTNSVSTSVSSSTMSAYATPIAIVLAGLFIGGGLFMGLSKNKSNPSVSTGNQQAQQEALNTTKDQMAKLIKAPEKAYLDTDLASGKLIILGHADAPLTITYWYDYQCPFCKTVDVGGDPRIPIQPSIPTIISKYVNTGKVKLIFKSFPFLGADSTTGAEYAHAIWKLYPEKFFDWHTAMMQVQDAEGDQGFGNAETIDILISLIPGIDDAKVKQYIIDNKDTLDATISAEQKDGSNHGVTGTPGFRIGTKQIDGAQKPQAFIDAIESQLK